MDTSVCLPAESLASDIITAEMSEEAKLLVKYEIFDSKGQLKLYSPITQKALYAVLKPAILDVIQEEERKAAAELEEDEQVQKVAETANAMIEKAVKPRRKR